LCSSRPARVSRPVRSCGFLLQPLPVASAPPAAVEQADKHTHEGSRCDDTNYAARYGAHVAVPMADGRGWVDVVCAEVRDGEDGFKLMCAEAGHGLVPA